ncbi:MAG: 30S processome protein Utp24 [Candidatus Diapherotrites archaeon]|nr:30S processome protein Utp24 [Candidatus Diapherotrites archaeon]
MVSSAEPGALVVIFDTNMLLVPAQFGIDVFTQIKQKLSSKTRFVTIGAVEEELEKISAKSPKYKKIVELTRKIMKKEDVVALDGPKMFFGPTDDAIIQYALEMHGIVATNDKELRAKLRKKGIRCAFLRSKKFIEIE